MVISSASLLVSRWQNWPNVGMLTSSRVPDVSQVFYNVLFIHYTFP
jgi:hypothetical protein